MGCIDFEVIVADLKENSETEFHMLYDSMHCDYRYKLGKNAIFFYQKNLKSKKKFRSRQIDISKFICQRQKVGIIFNSYAVFDVILRELSHRIIRLPLTYLLYLAGHFHLDAFWRLICVMVLCVFNMMRCFVYWCKNSK